MIKNINWVALICTVLAVIDIMIGLFPRLHLTNLILGILLLMAVILGVFDEKRYD